MFKGGHGGAKQGDHVIPVTERPDLALVMSNIRAAHGAPGNPCARCSEACGRKVHCNQVRGMGSIDRALRLIAGWAAEHAAETPPERDRPRTTGYTAGRPAQSGGGADPGRDW